MVVVVVEVVVWVVAVLLPYAFFWVHTHLHMSPMIELPPASRIEIDDCLCVVLIDHSSLHIDHLSRISLQFETVVVTDPALATETNPALATETDLALAIETDLALATVISNAN